MKIAIVAGGTGGHIYPGLAIAEEFKRRTGSHDILFIGSREGLEKDLVPQAGFKVRLISSRALPRRLSLKSFTAPFIVLWGFFQALSLLRSYRPQVLISTGGYASLPSIIAAWFLRVPIYVHEQNVLPGMANRFSFRFARKALLSFERSLDFVSGVVVGNPVRRAILAADRETARRRSGYAPSDRVFLVMGGSQGARRINQSVAAALPLIRAAGTRIIHLVGRRDRPMVDQIIGSAKYGFYRRADYLYDMADALAAADIAISRAGATAIAEFMARGIPMVLVPYPFSAEGHQDLNAQVIADAGAGIVVRDSDFDPQKFIQLLKGEGLDLVRMGKNALKLARPQAAEEIVNAIL